MYETEEANDDIDINMLAFIGSNKEKNNFNTFKIPLNFLSDIYNGKISLKEAEFNQRNLEKNRRSIIQLWTKKEKRKEINGVLMQANDLLEYRSKIIKAFKDGTFLSGH